MHFETLAPLARLWPLLIVALLGLGLFVYLSGKNRRAERRKREEYERRYWIEEVAHRAKMRVRGLLFGSRAPRLTYRDNSGDVQRD